MVKKKRGVRSQSDEPQTPVPEPDITPPTSAPSQPKNPFAKWLIGLLALTILIVGGPIALWAQTDAGGKHVTVEETQLQKIQEQLNSLEQTMRILVDAQRTGAAADESAAGVSCKCSEHEQPVVDSVSTSTGGVTTSTQGESAGE